MSADHAAQIRAALAALGRDSSNLRGWTLIQRAFSGADVFRLDFPDRQLILKLSSADDERFERELSFLRDLADATPLRTPQLLAAHEGALLFPAYRPINWWRDADYVKVAGELARFHAAYWDKTGPLDRYPWLRREESEAGIEARTNWQKLRDQKRLSAAFSAADWREIERLLGCVRAIEQVICEVPPTLCHNDFHPDNVLLDGEGRFVVIDWQEVGVGRGPEDLAFFTQRAAENVPVAAMLQAYTAMLVASGIAVTGAMIGRVFDACELRRRLVHWPIYLQDAPLHVIAALVVRVIALAEELEIR